jgi:hypothetical protein
LEKDVKTQSILWRGFTLEGHEACRLSWLNSQWHLEGSSVFSHQQQPCRLDYQVVCDSGWQTLAGKVAGWLGTKEIHIELSVDSNHHWKLNGVARPEVSGCIDLDLNFSPCTNLLPIRRLGLAVGQEAEIRAAWLRFPSFELETLPQVYRRMDESTYHYESGSGRFAADLQVNPNGFVTDYPGIWRAEAIT